MNSFNKNISFTCGKTMKNPFMLAPMTNQQSHEDGTLSEDEFRWLTLRAKGGFGLTMTCASHVQAAGKGFPGQLGIFSQLQEVGHRRLSKAIKEEGSLAVVQLHHAGMRSPKELIAKSPMCPSDIEKYDAKAMTIRDIEQLRKDFIQSALRAKSWGYDGVEVHGAHGYIIGQFLSKDINHREDHYGGSLENRSRLLFEIVDGIRKKCGPEFLVGVRLSPERFGMRLNEIKSICERFVKEDQIDFLDISVWDWKKLPEEEEYQNKTLLKHFSDLNYGNIKLTIAGKIHSAADVKEILDQGVDFVAIGKAGILHHDFPEKVMANPDFVSIETPVSKDYLISEGLGSAFVDYMGRWPGFME